MIARIVPNHGTGSAEAAIRYIAGEENHKGEDRDKVVHLFGDGPLIIDLTESMNCKHTYLSSILSFTKEESERISIDLIRELTESFAQHHAEPFGTSSIAGCAYLHVQNGRYDVHLIQAQMDLKSGKRVDLYLDSCGDTKRIAAWQDIQNHKHKLDDPRDPARKRLISGIIREAKGREEMRTFINDELQQLHIEGSIKSRIDVRNALTGLGFEISRQAKTSISIKSSHLKQNIRLKGEIYHESYAGIKGSQKAIRSSQSRSEEDARKQYLTARIRLEQANKKRTCRLSKKLNIDLEARSQRLFESDGKERKDVFDTILIGDIHDRRSLSMDSEINRTHGTASSSDDLPNNVISKPQLCHRTTNECPEGSEWKIPDQATIGVTYGSAKHEITNPFVDDERDECHERTMRNLSDCSRSIDRASQRIGFLSDSIRSASSGARRGITEAIERIAGFIARLPRKFKSTFSIK